MVGSGVVGAKINLSRLGSEHWRIINELIVAGFHIMLINSVIGANPDATSLIIQAVANRLGKPILLKLKGTTFQRLDLQTYYSIRRPQTPVLLLQLLGCELPSSLKHLENNDGSESAADTSVDVIGIKQNGLIEITGMVVKNQTEIRIKWTAIDDVMSESSALVTRLLKMLRFIGENAQISYSGGISAIVGLVPPLLNPSGSVKTVDAVAYVGMVALASGVLFAAFSWMLTKSKRKKDLGIITPACAFFSMITGLFCAILGHIPPKYRACLVSISMIFLLVVAFYASADQDIETESGGYLDPKMQ